MMWFLCWKKQHTPRSKIKKARRCTNKPLRWNLLQVIPPRPLRCRNFPTQQWWPFVFIGLSSASRDFARCLEAVNSSKFKAISFNTTSDDTVNKRTGWKEEEIVCFSTHEYTLFGVRVIYCGLLFSSQLSNKKKTRCIIIFFRWWCWGTLAVLIPQVNHLVNQHAYRVVSHQENQPGL